MFPYREFSISVWANRKVNNNHMSICTVGTLGSTGVPWAELRFRGSTNYVQYTYRNGTTYTTNTN